MEKDIHKVEEALQLMRGIDPTKLSPKQRASHRRDLARMEKQMKEVYAMRNDAFGSAYGDIT